MSSFVQQHLTMLATLCILGVGLFESQRWPRDHWFQIGQFANLWSFIGTAFAIMFAISAFIQFGWLLGLAALLAIFVAPMIWVPIRMLLGGDSVFLSSVGAIASIIAVIALFSQTSWFGIFV